MLSGAAGPAEEAGDPLGQRLPPHMTHSKVAGELPGPDETLKDEGWSLRGPGFCGWGGTWGERGTVGGALGHLDWSLRQEQGIKMIPVAGGSVQSLEMIQKVRATQV